MREFIAASVQITVQPHAFRENLEKICAWHEQAVRECHAELVVFPESVTSGFHPAMSARAFRRLIPKDLDTYLRPLCRLTRATRSYCVLSTYERGRGPGQVYNSALLIGADGGIVGTYRKTHPFPTEQVRRGGWTTPGRQAPVFATGLGTIGIIICYDGDFPELTRALAVQGAEIIARPSAFLRNFEIWDMTNRARAYENNLYMVAANAIGSDAAGNQYYGHSMIVSPAADKLALARSGEEIIYARLAPRLLGRGTARSRVPRIVDHLGDRNVASYHPHLLQP
ncbi:MAG TPA: carbon-nitrogen hydrolase family protein [bacterium]|mgnify:CR=1 FL=1|nr:carbon-nitrogen hydrolase family protein [bacterium]